MKSRARSAMDSPLVERVRRSIAWPPNWVRSLRAARILLFEYGHLRSVSKKTAIDGQGKATPWYTYPAIEFLRQLDFSEKSVFEYGCGNSTIFWSGLARRVVSVETSEKWHAAVSRQVSANATVILEQDLDAFVCTIASFPGPYDIIVVDGPVRGRTRLKCCRAAVEHVAAGGMIILDNSDWLPESAALLRSAGLLEVDMTGFAPINAGTSTTSFFFDRRFDFPQNGPRTPRPGVGGLPFDWESPRTVTGESVEIGDDRIPGVKFDAPLAIEAPDGTRRYRFLIHLLDETRTAVTIVDEQSGRILLDCHSVPDPPPDLERELRWFQQMNYEEFRAFINRHPRRRYRL